MNRSRAVSEAADQLPAKMRGNIRKPSTKCLRVPTTSFLEVSLDAPKTLHRT